MKRLVVLVVMLASLSAFASTNIITPLLNGQLQGNLNGNTNAITNLAKMTFPDGSSFTSGGSYQFNGVASFPGGMVLPLSTTANSLVYSSSGYAPTGVTLGTGLSLSGGTLSVVGLASISNNLVGPTTISPFPASGTNWINPSVGNITVYLSGAGVSGATLVKINNVTVYVLSGTVPPLSFELQTNEFFSVTYSSGTPSGVWKPL
jgi:hypothetical protein